MARFGLPDILNFWPGSAYQSRTNPTQPDRFPDENETDLELPSYRYTEDQDRWHARLRLLWTVLAVALLAIFDLAYLYVPGTHYWERGVFAAALLIAALYVGQRSGSIGLTFLLGIAAAVYAFFAPVPPLWAIGWIAALLVADAFATHYLYWKTAFPMELGRSRALREAWSKRFSPFSALPPELRGYRLALLGAALAVSPLLIPEDVLRFRVAEPNWIGLQVLASVVILLVWPLVIWLLLGGRFLGIRSTYARYRNAVVHWYTYNRVETLGVGMLKSPAGSYVWRKRVSLAVVLLFAVPLVQTLSWERQKLRFIDEVGQEQIAQWQAEQGQREQQQSEQAGTADRESSPGINERSEVALYQRKMLERMTPEERAAYSQARRRPQSQSIAPLDLRQSPDPTSIGFQKWGEESNNRSALIMMLFAAASSLNLALVLFPPLFAGLTAPLLFLAICYCTTNRLISQLGASVVSLGHEQLLQPEHWDSIVGRLHHSRNPIEKESLFLGLNAADGAPVLVPRNVFKEHAHLFGDTGSGKSAGMAALIAQLTRFGDSSVVILDLKADDLALFEGARLEAARAGLPFRWFTNELGRTTYSYNPLGQKFFERLSLYQRTDVLTAAMGLQYGSDYGRGYFSDANAELIYQAFRARPYIASFAELADTLEHLPAHLVQSSLRKDAGHVHAIVNRLAATEALNVKPGDSLPSAVFDQAIDMGDVFATPQVLYFYLPSALGTAMSAEIARFALYSLLAAAKAHSGPRKQVYLFIDEFQRIVAKNLELILQTARSMNVGVILANQTLADLKASDVDLASTVRGNCRIKQVFSASDPIDQQLLIDTSGERIVLNRTWEDAFYIFARGFYQMVTKNYTEHLTTRLTYNDVLLAGDHRQQCILQVRRGEGYAQYGGMPFVMAFPFHITPTEFSRRRDEAEWPEVVAGTICPAMPRPVRRLPDQQLFLPDTEPKSQETALEPAQVPEGVSQETAADPVPAGDELPPNPFDGHFESQRARRQRQ